MGANEPRRNDGTGSHGAHPTNGARDRLPAADHQSEPSTRAWRQAQWLQTAGGRLRRQGRVLRVAAALLAAVGLLSVTVVGGVAQAAGAEIGIRDLSEHPMHLTVDSFPVELSNLSSIEVYQVIVSSDRARLGVGGCGESSQTATVTDAATEDLTFHVYACAPGGATVTAEVRRAGDSDSEASVSQRLTVEALPEFVITASGERIRTTQTTMRGVGAARAAARAGTPGIVPSVSLSRESDDSNVLIAEWGTPSDGGTPLTGFGVKFWRDSDGEPPYTNVEVVGPSARSKRYTGLEWNTRYKLRVHACNGTDSCGYWTDPPEDKTTPEDTLDPPARAVWVPRDRAR
ncbi:MAG: fibronectin type III domain-containing protein [Chloroflexi bacterium]|nr:fibronectin type III domain-containing protein [Chloroflexota bacterium]